MADEWYYSTNGNRLGPVTTARLRYMATMGQILPTDLVWREGQAAWKPANKFVGLFSDDPRVPVSASSPPPLPPRPPVPPPKPPQPSNAGYSQNTACPACRQPILNDPSLAGQVVACPHCSCQFVMPGPSVANRLPLRGDRHATAKRLGVTAFCVVALAILLTVLFSVDKARLPQQDPTKSHTPIKMTVNEFGRKVVGGQFQEDQFYKAFGRPLEIRSRGDDACLLYQCTDGVIQLRTPKTVLQFQHLIVVFTFDQL